MSVKQISTLIPSFFILISGLTFFLIRQQEPLKINACIKKFDNNKEPILIFPSYKSIYCSDFKKSLCYTNLIAHKADNIKHVLFFSNNDKDNFFLKHSFLPEAIKQCASLLLIKITKKPFKHFFDFGRFRKTHVFLTKMFSGRIKKCLWRSGKFSCSASKWNKVSLETSQKGRFLKLHLNQWWTLNLTSTAPKDIAKNAYVYFGFSEDKKTGRKALLGFGRLRIYSGAKLVLENFFYPEQGLNIKKVHLIPNKKVRFAFDCIGSRFGHLLLQVKYTPNSAH